MTATETYVMKELLFLSFVPLAFIVEGEIDAPW